METKTTARIRALNDELRVHGRGGIALVTQGILAFGVPFAARARALVRRDQTFAEDNDPYAEHDFGAVSLDGEKIFWKIDYYDLERRYGSTDPSDPDATSRVLTIMLAEEY